VENFWLRRVDILGGWGKLGLKVCFANPTKEEGNECHQCLRGVSRKKLTKAKFHFPETKEIPMNRHCCRGALCPQNTMMKRIQGIGATAGAMGEGQAATAIG
jgi:hypothetical protein